MLGRPMAPLSMHGIHRSLVCNQAYFCDVPMAQVPSSSLPVQGYAQITLRILSSCQIFENPIRLHE